MATSRKLFWIATLGSTAICYPMIMRCIQPRYLAEKERPDRTAIVTGATGNLGGPITYHLARRKLRVIMACRDMDKCKSLRREIVLHTNNKGVVCRHIDLEDIDSINKFADEIIKNEPHIDILINNAAIKHTNKRELTKYGIEKHLFVNFLAPYLLTFRLLDKLTESASLTRSSRIINVIGNPKKDWNFDLEDANFEKRPFNSKTAYNQSKLALAYFTILLEKFNRERKNRIYVFGTSPSTNRIGESFKRPIGLKEEFKSAIGQWYYYHPERVIGSVIKCALDRDIVKRGSGKLYNYFLSSIGFKGAWGVAAENETKAKLVWNMAADLLLKAPDQLKQEEKSKTSADKLA